MQSLNLKQLEYFSVVAQYGSINKAAQALYVSQPHLSHILQDLEEDIGTALLTRTKKGVQLTEEGRHFLQHSQKILGEMNQLQGLFHKQERSGNTFRVSMTKFSHTMESFIDILNQWSQEPELSFRLNEGSSMDVIADVESGYSDLGVLHFEYTPDSPFPRIFEEKKLEYRHLSEIRPHIVLSQNHPLLRVGHAPTLGEFRPYGFVRYIGEYEDFTYNLSINGVHYDLDDSPKIASVYGRASLLHLISAGRLAAMDAPRFRSRIVTISWSLDILSALARRHAGLLRNSSKTSPAASTASFPDRGRTCFMIFAQGFFR